MYIGYLFYSMIVVVLGIVDRVINEICVFFYFNVYFIWNINFRKRVVVRVIIKNRRILCFIDKYKRI